MTLKIIQRKPKHHIVKASDTPRIGGEFCLTVYHEDGTVSTSYPKNLIVDAGIKRLGDILAAIESTDVDLGFMEPGSGTTTPVIGDTDTETPLTPADRLAATLQTRASASPFHVTIETFVNSTKYTRPQTINELCVFFTPDETGVLFARGKLDTAITLNANDVATLTYSILFR